MPNYSDCQLDAVHDKRAVAKSFGNAASTYDPVAGLQQRVGDKLVSLLDKYADSQRKTRVLDVGCGTGYIINRLAEKTSESYALDIAYEMLRFAKKESRQKNICYLCADAEAIPLKDSSVDVVISNFAIQWCPDRRGLFREISRVLVPGGLFVFSMPGVDTLHELKQSWKKADPTHTHVNRFCSIDEVAMEIAETPLLVESLDASKEVMHYDKLQELTHELKALGAHNVTDGRAKQLTGKNTIKRLVAAYDELRDQNDKLPATWNVIYGVLSNQTLECGE